MKVLFFNPEQYVNFDQEPSNYELRLPILNSGVVTSHRDYVYQRVLRNEGREAMNRKALLEVSDFNPDLVVYSTSWPHESIDRNVFQQIMNGGVPVFTHVWDTQIEQRPHEMEWFLNCNYFGVADSVSNYLRYASLASIVPGVRSVLFTGGNIVFTDLLHQKALDKRYDVTLVGSNEGERAKLVRYLRERLASSGISFNKFGGLVDSTKGPPERGLTDQWIPIERYVDIINQSRICLSSQTVPLRNQIKGKVFHYMACGALCLSERNAELKQIVPDDCVVYYEGFEDCANKILYYLAHEGERLRIAQAGWRWFHQTFNYKKFWCDSLQAMVDGERKLPNICKSVWVSRGNSHCARGQSAAPVEGSLEAQSSELSCEQRVGLNAGVSLTRKTSRVKVLKDKRQPTLPQVSLILLDWSCRERFHALDWLSKQDVPRDQYELIWVELHDRAVAEVMEKADVVITCGQKGVCHKHVGYNIGLLHARGAIITICDSDVISPPDFISSIVRTFNLNGKAEPKPLVLMHSKRRTSHQHPQKLSDISELREFPWQELRPNVGACMSVRRADAIRFGGFDEHHSCRGYLCGPYDLGWRMINAGIAEIWHDPGVALWHFAHPASDGMGTGFTIKRWREIIYRHIDCHVMTAVEAFSSGRILPLQENPEIHRLRMSLRRIGTPFEEKYARMSHFAQLSRWRRFVLEAALLFEPFRLIQWQPVFPLRACCFSCLRNVLGNQKYAALRQWWHSVRGNKHA
ncbi:MAG: glycosyltransferase [Verrucomicrobiia bacterium]